MGTITPHKPLIRTQCPFTCHPRVPSIFTCVQRSRLQNWKEAHSPNQQIFRGGPALIAACAYASLGWIPRSLTHPSKVRAWHKDKKNTERYGDCSEHKKCHRRTCSKKPPNEWLSNPRPVHESVFAEAEESHDQVELVLVTDQQVGAQCKWQDELGMVS